MLENGSGRDALEQEHQWLWGSCFGALPATQTLCAVVMDGLPLCFVLLGQTYPEEQRTLME